MPILQTGKHCSLQGKVTCSDSEGKYWNKLKVSQTPGFNGFTRLPPPKSAIYFMNKYKFVAMEYPQNLKNSDRSWKGNKIRKMKLEQVTLLYAELEFSLCLLTDRSCLNFKPCFSFFSLRGVEGKGKSNKCHLVK